MLHSGAIEFVVKSNCQYGGGSGLVLCGLAADPVVDIPR